MATAPVVLDPAAQKMVDLVVASVKATAEETATKQTEAFDAKLAEHSANTDTKLAALDEKVSAIDADAVEKQGRALLRGWTTVPKGHPYKLPSRPEEMALRGARICRALAACRFDPTAVPKFLRDKLNDKEVQALAEKSLETGTPSKGGLLTLDQLLVNEFYPMLREKLAFYDLGARMLPMPKGTLTMVGMDSGTSMGWVGEAKRGNTSRPGFGRIKLSSKKAYGNVAISNDLLEESDWAVDEMVRDDLLAVLAELLLTGGLHGPGTEYAPRGIDTDARRTQVTIGSLMTSDVPSEFIYALMVAKVDFTEEDAGWLFGPHIWKQFFNLKTTTGAYIFRDEMRQGRLLGYRYKVATLVNVASGGHGLTHIFFGKWSELIIGVTRDMQFEESREAKITDEDGNEVNAWEEDMTFIKLTHKCDIGLRQAKAMAHSNDAWTIA